MERDAISMLVARNIEAVMARKRMTPAEVNRKAGLGQTGVNDIISGKSGSPKVSTLRKIAEDALEVPVISLLMEPNEDPLDQEIFEALGMLPRDERRKFLRIAQAMKDADPGGSGAAPPEAV